MTPSLISIVVITRNRVHIIDTCLRHILAQEGAPFEVIVVDASDYEETEELMARYPQVQYLHIENATNQMPRSRNEGIRMASGEVIAFVDDDSLVQPGWLQSLASHYADPSVGGAGGLVLAPGEQPRQGGVVGRMRPRGTPLGDFTVLTPGPVRVEHLMGCNMSFLREALVSLGGFDCRYNGSNFREDTDMCVRVRRAGYGLVYDPKACVVHLYARKEEYGRDDRIDEAYRFSVAKNTTYFRLKHFFSPLTIVGLLAGQTRALLSALRGRQSLALSSAEVKGQWAGVKTYLGSLRKDHSSHHG